MASHFVPCSSCRRHVGVGDARCPFCGAALVAKPGTVSPVRGARHAFLVASTLASALALPACDNPKPATETAQKESIPSATASAVASNSGAANPTASESSAPVASVATDAGAATGSGSALGKQAGPKDPPLTPEQAKLLDVLAADGGSNVLGPGTPGLSNPPFGPGQTAYGGPPLNPGLGIGTPTDAGVFKEPVGQVVCGAASGAPDADAVIAKNRWRFKSCYQKELKVDPGSAGSVSLTLSVDDKGVVTSASAGASTLSSSLSGCIAAATRSMVFGVTAPTTVTFKVSLSTVK